ncbi:MAG: hypothetical protein VB097_10720 [Rikenellaceae bacterium]|nr:hypothetical protein [Rikenellaceae bacterium]
MNNLTVSSYACCELIRGVKPQTTGNEREAATRTSSASYKFIRGMDRNRSLIPAFYS